MILIHTKVLSFFVFFDERRLMAMLTLFTTTEESIWTSTKEKNKTILKFCTKKFNTKFTSIVHLFIINVVV